MPRKKASPAKKPPPRKRVKAGILLLPGLGGDERMFGPILKHLSPASRALARVVRLTAPVKNEPIPDYARRILMEQGFAGKNYAIVAGVSFGGMVTQEALRTGVVRAHRAALLATAFRGDDLTLLGKSSGFLLTLTPGFMRPLVLRVIAALYPVFRMGMPEAHVFARMLLDQDVDLYFRAPTMILNWAPAQAGRLPCPFFHLQGTSDPLISYERLAATRIPDVPIHKGNHLVFVSQAPLIAAEFEKYLKSRA